MEISYESLTMQQRIAAFLHYANNRIECNKYCLGAYLDRLIPNSMYGIYSEFYKRETLYETLVEKLNEDNFYKLFTSDYMQAKVVLHHKLLNPSKSKRNAN